MKLDTIHIGPFASLLRSCRGRVYIQTAEGDRLNADSLLCSVIGLAQVYKVAEKQDIRIIADEAEDQKRIDQFLKRPVSAVK